jgi:hypothetical protein
MSRMGSDNCTFASRWLYTLTGNCKAAVLGLGVALLCDRDGCSPKIFLDSESLNW